MTRVHAGLAALAICRVFAGLTAVAWLLDLRQVLIGHCPLTARDSILYMSMGQDVSE